MSAADLKAQAGVAFKEKDFTTAVDLFTQAIELSPEDHTLYSNR
jgi:Flp pilus assembly protein TadD